MMIPSITRNTVKGIGKLRPMPAASMATVNRAMVIRIISGKGIMKD